MDMATQEQLLNAEQSARALAAKLLVIRDELRSQNYPGADRLMTARDSVLAALRIIQNTTPEETTS